MILQVVSDCVINGPSGCHVCGPGELLTLPVHQAMKVLCLEPEHFRIVAPTPLIPGVAVRWLLPDDTAQGPGAVQLVDGERPNRRISVLIDGELRWIHERDITEVDPWPAIDARLEEVWPFLLIDGETSPRVAEMRAWMIQHFDDDLPIAGHRHSSQSGP